MSKRNPYNLKQGDMPDKDFNRTQLKKGANVEREHSNNYQVDKSIAKAHLKENPNYYKDYNGKGKEYLVSDSKKGVYCK